VKHGKGQEPILDDLVPYGLTAKHWMEARLHTAYGRKIYSRDKEIAEPVFGQIKQVRGFRQFLLRGKDKVKAEWTLICLTHNLLKLFRSANIAIGTWGCYLLRFFADKMV
jgi:hypothetical protein